MENCIFCKIVAGEIPAKIVFEDKEIVAFRDAHPQAPVHILIIPKRHIGSVANLEEKDQELAGRIIMAGKKIAEDLNISEKGYKLLFRVGNDGGQEISHVHLHLMGGAKLHEEIRPE